MNAFEPRLECGEEKRVNQGFDLWQTKAFSVDSSLHPRGTQLLHQLPNGLHIPLPSCMEVHLGTDTFPNLNADLAAWKYLLEIFSEALIRAGKIQVVPPRRTPTANGLPRAGVGKTLLLDLQLREFTIRNRIAPTPGHEKSEIGRVNSVTGGTDDTASAQSRGMRRNCLISAVFLSWLRFYLVLQWMRARRELGLVKEALNVMDFILASSLEPPKVCECVGIWTAVGPG